MSGFGRSVALAAPPRSWRYCVRCVLPDTRPGLVLDAEGVCNACRGHAARPRVDWAARDRELDRVLAAARDRAEGHDCLIPVSGGKDSTWQVVECLRRGMRPLCVTWRPPGRTGLGRRNLENLIGLGVDHIDYSIDPGVEARFARAALRRAGDPAIPMHMALFAIPLTVAACFRIPLVVFGENSAVEYGSDDGSGLGHRLDAAWVRRFGVTAGTSWRDWTGAEGLTDRELVPYRAPADEELAAAGCEAVFLGHYLPWDPARTAAVAREHGFRGGERARTGVDADADVDDAFIAVHHWLKWHKFGFTRSFDNLSLEIRNGRVTREQAVARIVALGDERPAADIAAFCAFAGITVEEFEAIADGFRDPRVWDRDARGRWTIPGFIDPGRDWT